MPSEKLTDGRVEAINPEPRDVYVWDTELRRFGVRVTPAGARIYLVQYRAKADTGPGRTRRITIGKHDGDLWNVTKARAAARKLLAPVDLARDPFAEREADQAAQRAAVEAAERAEAEAAREAVRLAREAFTEVVDRYVEACLTKNRSGGETERLLKHGPVKVWADRPISALRRRDVAELCDEIKARSPSVARATFAALRGLFGWAVERDLIDASPCHAVTAPPRPAARDRVLSDEELRLIWKASDGLGFPFGPIVKLLMLTGQRRAEVAGMAWAELDLEKATWRIPAERSKNGKAHEVDLSPPALAVLQGLERDGALLFPARGEGAARGFSATKRRLDALVETIRQEERANAGEPPPAQPMTPWRLHDLRRTAATGMAAMGFPPHVVERVLNHISGAQSGLVGVYQRHEYRAERKASLTAWGGHVAGLMGGSQPKSNVIPIRA